MRTCALVDVAPYKTVVQGTDITWLPAGLFSQPMKLHDICIIRFMSETEFNNIEFGRGCSPYMQGYTTLYEHSFLHISSISISIARE